MTDQKQRLSDAGRELDARVAEKVIGWPPKPNDAHLWWYKSHHCGESGYNPMMGDTCPGCHGVSPVIQAQLKIEARYEALPHFSTSIADAFEVVEKMRERGYAFQLWTGAGIWSAWFALPPDAVFIESGLPAAPLAICLAALAAIEATEKESTLRTPEDK